MKTIKLTSEEYIELLENERKELLRDISRKDKEIERLKAREKECIEHYQVALKYANEMEERIIKAMHFVDQVLGYHLSSGYEQLDKNCNELFGILKGVDK